MEEAVKVGARTVAFPSISTGIFGYPLAEATRVAVETIHEFAGDFSCRLVAFSPADFIVIEPLVHRAVDLGRREE
jgi:O-acetyl-ADP-ribose deacetylase